MRIIYEASKLTDKDRRCVLTIGNFDGTHLGHRKIITVASEAAKDRNLPLVAMTFEPHPVAVLFPEKSHGVLTPLELKKALLSEARIESLFVVKSTAEVLGLSPEDFVVKFLNEALEPVIVVEGEDFNFGAKRAGSIQTLRQLGQKHGFDVTVVPAERIELSCGEQARVSSTLIRNLIESGQVTDAAKALGRAYRLVGTVVAGRGKGKHLGFPTANLDPLDQIIPAEAVYAGFVEIGDTVEQVCKASAKIPAALSIGRAPTIVTDHAQLIEAHILMDDVPDLLGKYLAMDFVGKLRDQQKFESEEELASQIGADCEDARKCLFS
jgi:riboflavin kinase/FMN adenylyltransferase